MEETAAAADGLESLDAVDNATQELTILKPLPGPFPDRLDILVSDVRTAHDLAVNGQGPERDRILERNRKIRGFFSDFATERKSAYEAFLCQVAGYLAVKGETGRSKERGGWLQFPGDTVIDPGTVQFTGEGHKPVRGEGDRRWVIEGHKLHFRIGKAGDGKHTGGLVARARLSPQAVARYIEVDLQRVRDRLAMFALPDDRAKDPA